ncbi:Bacterial sugar transferase [Gaiella occulta]|uniref:Bacterial sugar transferase n=1 Tax=Gaiella occulta TaxID=1002870 RepID=A0A7M2YXY1_9ACTN|nr:Bacterial sugar transferase [Gaiella occulta]
MAASAVGARVGPGETCRRRLDEWQAAGVWDKLHELLLARLQQAGEIEVKLDYLYVTNWSLWWDTKLLLRTVPVVFKRRGY